jgi:peptidoglycan/LPS O-acetylase OafA/YrhL
VDVFFVVSGFLITLLLLRERQKTGEVSASGFYRRRCLRILPAYVTFVLVLAALAAVDFVRLRDQDWCGALTYTVNWFDDPSWEVGHIWSLSLEEHFYLLWPLLFLLGPRWAWRFAWICIAAMPLTRLLMWMNWKEAAPVETSTLTRLDTIAVGCVLAFLAWQPRGRRLGAWAARSTAWLGPVAVLTLITSIACSLCWYRFRLLVGISLNAAAIAVLIWLCITQKEGVLRRLLESRPLVTLGTLSYSVYLWQQLFLNPYSTVWVCRWPLNLTCVFLAATASYLIVERPFLRLKERTPVPAQPSQVSPVLVGKDA